MDQGPTRDAVLSAYPQALIKFKARRLCRESVFNRSDEDDFVQELTLTLMEKIHLFDPSRGSLNTFAARVINSKIAMLLRDRRRLKREAGFRAQSLEQLASCDADTAPLRDSLPSSGPSVQESIEQADFILAVRNAVQSLPPNLQEVATRLKVDPVSAVARDMGISRRQVRKAIERIRKHLEEKGLRDF